MQDDPLWFPLFDRSPAATIVTDAAGRILLVNRRTEELFGYRRGELIGQEIECLVPERLRARHAAHRAAWDREDTFAMRSPRSLTALRRDGTELPVDIALSRFEADGQILIAACIHDVSENRRKERELAAKMVQMDRMIAVGTLAAGVAHEINNPLAYVLANIEFALQPGANPADVRDALAEALEGARRVRQIVRDLKTLSRNDDEARRPIELHPVLESAISMAQNEIRHRAQLVRNYGSVPPVEANESRLGQVFLNLLVNAAQAIPDGNALSNRITVATSTDAGGRAVIDVEDTGSGILPEHLPRLFDPFFTTKPIGFGTGLGLAICHGIVTAMNGQILVSSQRGEGTRFRVVLPAAQMRPSTATADAVPAPALRPARVLVVDDDAFVVKSLLRLLADHDATGVTSAAEALERIARGARFEVILCDLMMPDMTGMDLHARLAALAPDQASAMIFLTGGAFTESGQQFLAKTENRCIEKPFQPEAVLSAIAERLAR